MNSCTSETVFTTTQFAIANAAPRAQQHSQKTERITQMIKHAQLPSPGLQLLVATGMRWAGHVACMGEEKSVQGVGGKAGRKEITQKTKA
jgi:hypothetical protein